MTRLAPATPSPRSRSDLLVGVALLITVISGCRTHTDPVRFSPETLPLSDVRSFALPGEEPFPTDLAIAADGAVWYVERRNSVIGRFDPETEEFLGLATATPASAPYGISIASDGSIWYTASAAGLLGRINPTTLEVAEYPLPAEARDPIFLATSGDRVWFTVRRGESYGFIRVSTGAVEIIQAASERSRPYAITAAADGCIWMSFMERNAIARIDAANGSLREYPLPDPRSRARRIVVDASGRVWYTDFSRGRLGLLDPRTGVVREFFPPGASISPYGMTLGPGGRVWYGDMLNRALVAFDPASETHFTVPLPLALSEGVVRNMAVDVERGRIWMVISESGAIGRLDVRRVEPSRRASARSSRASRAQPSMHAECGTLNDSLTP